jgi:hypothetical protein
VHLQWLSMLQFQGGEVISRGAILGRGGETMWGDARLLMRRSAARLCAVAQDRWCWLEGSALVGFTEEEDIIERWA